MAISQIIGNSLIELDLARLSFIELIFGRIIIY